MDYFPKIADDKNLAHFVEIETTRQAGIKI